MACSLRGIAAVLVLLLPATPVIAFNAPVLASLLDPTIDTCAADPEGWVKGPVISAAQEAAVQKVLTAQHNASFLWGTYQPNQYFCIKSRTTPASLASGVLWHGPGRTVADARSECRQEDWIQKYGWTQHDGRHFGRQVIEDTAQKVRLVTEFVRLNGKDGYWAARIQVTPDIPAKKQKQRSSEMEGEDEDPRKEYHSHQRPAAVYFYLAIDCDGNVEAGKCLQDAGGEHGLKLLVDRGKGSGAAYIHGKTKDLGDFTLEVGVRSVDRSSSSSSNNNSTSGSSNSGRSGKKISATGSTAPLSISYWGGSGVVLADLKAKLEDEGRRIARASGSSAHKIRGMNVLPNEIPANSNVVVLRVASAGSFHIDARLRARVPPDADEDDDEKDEPGEEDIATLKALLDRTTTQGLQDFRDRFAKLFVLDQHGYRGRSFTSEEIEAAEAAFSNMIGGVGYFHGQTPIKGRSINHGDGQGGRSMTAILNSFPTSLFTAVPSRSFFPRGFLWDEGFHQLLLHKWDLALTYDVLLHWLSHMHAHKDCPDLGWIPREIALGEQARRRIPAEFLPQDVTVANPPTFLLILEKMLALSENGTQQCEPDEKEGREGGAEIAMLRRSDFLEAIQDRLERWMRWLMSSQRGDERGSFRWRGRGDPSEKLMATTFASGLDDYPRASEPGPEERHVDLICWVIKGCQILSRLALAQSAPKLNGGSSAVLKVQQERGEKYARLAEELLGYLDTFHWNETLGGFFDYGMHSEDGFIGEMYMVRCGNPTTKSAVGVPVERSMLMQYDPEDPEGDMSPCPSSHPVALGLLSNEPTMAYVRGPEMISQHVPRVGYVSLFPFLLGLLPPDSPRLGPLLASLRDPAQLWSPYGIRSLSASDPFYQQENAPGDAPYWRGYIWINANYLALRSLWNLRRAAGPYQSEAKKMYTELRDVLLSTILGQYKATGYFWEQYNDATGEGMRCHPFTGWTALVVNIMAEDF
ncbi:hypothetical protein VYU27_002679 [Nannochloropsis oceanica]